MITKGQQNAALAILNQEIEENPEPDENGIYQPIIERQVGIHIVGMHVYTMPDAETVFKRGYRRYVRRAEDETKDAEFSDSLHEEQGRGWKERGKGRT